MTTNKRLQQEQPAAKRATTNARLQLQPNLVQHTAQHSTAQQSTSNSTSTSTLLAARAATATALATTTPTAELVAAQQNVALSAAHANGVASQQIRHKQWSGGG